MGESVRQQPTEFQWPTPTQSQPGWFAELAAAIRPEGNSGAAFEDDYSHHGASNINEHIIKKLLSDGHSYSDNGEFLFNKLQKKPHLRKSLSAVNKARAFNYGSRAFGNEKWYKENFDTQEGLKSNKERRQFRFGLKSNVDFLIQLDLWNLKALLQNNTFTPQGLTHAPPQSLSDGSFLSMMHTMDAQRCTALCTLLTRINDNLDFFSISLRVFRN